MMEIDGAIGEGGGQVLRTALSVACVKGQPVRIYNIRAGRESGGLKAQHLSVCRLLAEITGAKMEGAELGSREIVFKPGEISGGDYSFDIGTAGSITLLFQSALPVLAFAKSKSTLAIRGGTHVKAAPTYDYFEKVFLPAAREFGLKAESRMVRPGFYPKGGGEAVLAVEPSRLCGKAFSPQPRNSSLKMAANYSIISSLLPTHVGQREESVIRQMLAGYTLYGERKNLEAACAGNAVCVWSGFVGASSLGEQGKKAEKVAEEACRDFLAASASGASVDSHLADQLLLCAALAEGRSAFFAPSFTSHLRTNAEILRRMTARNIILAGEGRVEVL